MPVELVNLSVLGLVWGFLVSAKQPGRTLHQRPFSGVDLAGMDFEPAGQLGDSLVSLERGQGYLGLEGRAMLLNVIVSCSCSLYFCNSRSGTLS